MYIYQIGKGTPEGTDWSGSFTHKKKFTKDEFDAIVESLYLEVIKENIERLKKEKEYEDIGSMAGNLDSTCMEVKGVLERILDKGFEPLQIEQSHYAEPYWGWNKFKNKEILKLFSDEQKEAEKRHSENN